MQHLDEGTIHAWLDGALPAPEAAEVAKHAAECATCAAAVAEARGIIAGSARIVSALDDVPGGVIPSGRAPAPTEGTSMWHRLRLTPGRAALAATILLAVGTTLTVRSSSSPAPQANVDSIVSVAAPSAAASAPSRPVESVNHDSTKVLARSTVNAGPPRKANVRIAAPQTQTVAERREVADAAAPRETAKGELAKTRVAEQQVAAGASAMPTPPAAPTTARSNFAQAKALDLRADSVSGFEGCYRVSADSSSGSTEMPRGLPASFALSRPSAQPLAAARRAADARGEASVAPTVWRQLSTTQASVTFAAAASDAQPVSLVLTAGSPVGVASSGDRTTKVRVARSSCPP